MMNKRRTFWILFVAVLVAAGLSHSLAQQVPPEEPVQKEPVVEEQGKIIPSPKDIKEKTAVYVFLGWMWLSIIVLIFILKLKINEVDRLLHLKFFNEIDKK